MFKRLKSWYLQLSVKKQLAFTFSVLFVYWFLSWLFFEKVIWQGNRSWLFGVFSAVCTSAGITMLFEWTKVKSLFKKDD